MKKQLTFLVALSLLACSNTIAQATFFTKDSIDINNINAQLMVHGDMWWDPVAQVPKCEFPKGSGKHIGFASALWMSGYDAMGQLIVASQMYQRDTCEFWPGPLDTAGHITYATSQNWAKIWKVNRADINAFRALASHTTTNTPAAILTWPAAGNANAAGNGGVALTIAAGARMAPFVDLNSNGIYEPLAGEYPDIKGDQALWYVFNDNLAPHYISQTGSFKAEVHVMAYAYNRGSSIINNVVYYEYEIVNKSHFTWLNFRVGQFADMDLGYYADDYIGFDSVHRMGIQYTAGAADGASAGYPHGSYGTNAPVVGVSMVVMPGDAGSTYAPAGCFDYFNNDWGVIGNPTNGVQFSNYMRSMMRNGNHFNNDFAGYGTASSGMGTGAPVNYVFTGDPSDTSQWSECASNNHTGDRRFLISSNDFTMAPGQVQKVVMALVVTDTNQGGCPGVSFHDIKSVADTAWHYYYNPLPALGVAGAPAKNDAEVNVYPNPTSGILFIETAGNNVANEHIAIYNSIGQMINVPISGSGKKKEVSLTSFPAGMYYLLYRSGTTQQAIRFEKQ